MYNSNKKESLLWKFFEKFNEHPAASILSVYDTFFYVLKNKDKYANKLKN